MTTESTVRIFAPAKINWVLTIERKREDGFHDIHTVFQALSWGDELVCRPLPDAACRITCDDPAVPTGPDNLVAKAWRRLAEVYPGRVGGIDVRLIKRIPAGAGLGGGSADAAAALLAVSRLFRLRLTQTELERHAGALGSDCAFFVRGGAALGSARGERLEPLESRLPALALVVVFPGFTSPTAEAYRRVRPEHWENGRASARVAEAIRRGDVAALQKASRNVFNEIAIATDMRYKMLQDVMKKEGLAHPLLSGSGSAVFAYARDAAHAAGACRRLRQLYPVAVSARLRRRGVGIL